MAFVLLSALVGRVKSLAVSDVVAAPPYRLRRKPPPLPTFDSRVPPAFTSCTYINIGALISKQHGEVEVQAPCKGKHRRVAGKMV